MMHAHALVLTHRPGNMCRSVPNSRWGIAPSCVSGRICYGIRTVRRGTRPVRRVPRAASGPV
eukprot:3842427-Prymnesium_polylepis.1